MKISDFTSYEWIRLAECSAYIACIIGAAAAVIYTELDKRFSEKTRP